jgi:hypothetical protein
MTPSRLNDGLMALFFVSLFIQNATFSVGSVQVGFFIIPALLVVGRALQGKLRVVLTPRFRVAGVFLAYAVVRAFTSPHVGEALVVLVYFALDFLVMVACCTFVVYALRHRRERFIVGPINVLMGASVLIYLYLFASFDANTILYNFVELRDTGAGIRANASFFDLLSYSTVESGVLRFNGFYLDPNYWGMYAMTALYVVVVLSLHGHRTGEGGRWWYLRFAPPLLSGLFTFSRGFIVSLLVVVLTITAFTLINNPRQAIGLLLRVGAAVVVLAAVLLPTLYDDSLLTALFIEKTQGDIDQTSIARPFVWLTYLTIFANWPAENLFFGVGLNRLFYEDVGFFMATHNFVLQLVAMLGLLGLALHFYMSAYLARMLGWARRSFTGERLTYAVSLSFLVGLLLVFLFLDPLYHFPFWIYSGVSIGLVESDWWKIRTALGPDASLPAHSA